MSSFAIHHCAPARQRALYGEVFDVLAPGGAFVNLEHVASPTPELHDEFLAALGTHARDRRPVEPARRGRDHLTWLNACGFVNVDCFWKWRELAVVAGAKPGTTPDARRRTMSVIDFFEYLAAHEQTRELAIELADVWAAHASTRADARHLG